MPATRLAHIHHVSDDDNSNSSHSNLGGLFEDFVSHVCGSMSMRGLFFFVSSEANGEGEADYREADADVGSAACGRQRCLASKRRVDMYTNTPCSPAEGSSSSRASGCLAAEPKLEEYLPAAPKYPDYISSNTISRHRSRTSSGLSQMDTGRLRVSKKRNRSKRQDDPLPSSAAATTPEPISSGIDSSSQSSIAPTSTPLPSSSPSASSSTFSETTFSSSLPTTSETESSPSSVSLPTSIPVSLPSISIGITISVGLPNSPTEGSSSVPPVSSTTQSESTISTPTSTSTSESSSPSSSSSSSSSSSESSSSPSSSSSTQPSTSTQFSSSTQPPSSSQPPSSTQPSTSSQQPSSTQPPPSSQQPSSTQLPPPSSEQPLSTQPSSSSLSLPPNTSPPPPPSSTTTSTLPTSTVYSTITQFTTASPGTISISSSTVTSTGVLNTNGPSDGSRFAQNKGAIIGVAVGGVIAVIIAVVLLFLFCRTWRSKRAPSILPVESASPIVGLGSLRRDVSRGGLSGSSSRRMLTRNYSSTDPGHGGTWRPPLSDEDDDDPMQMAQIPPLPQSPMGVTGLSQGHSSSGEDLGNASVGHGSSQGGHSYTHDQYAAYYNNNIAPNADLVRRSSTQNQVMPGFGQAAEHMVVADLSSRTTTPMSPTFSIGPPPLPIPRSASFNKVPPPPSAYAYPSSSSHSHGSGSTDEFGLALGPGRKNGSGTSLMHTNTMKSATSSSSGSHSQSQSSIPVPRVRIQEATPTKAEGDHLRRRQASTGSVRGLISRLRGGRSSTQELDSISLSGKGKAKEVVPTPAPSSFYYPPTSPSTAMRPSSLLNPPLPPPPPPEPVEMQQLGVGLAPVPLGWIHPEPAPFPSPAPTEESSLHAPDGLLDPQLLSGSGSASRSDLHALGQDVTPRPSMSSLRDNIDYSRPYRGFVFNRMGSSTTFNTQDTRSTHAHTPGPSMLGVDDRIEESEYFGIAR